MEDGTIYRAKMFLDATYEGDLMAMAGVSFTFGREGTNVYGESLNGLRANTPAHQFPVNVDPYVVPGNPDPDQTHRPTQLPCSCLPASLT